MKRKLLNVKEIPPSCSYCIYGRLSPDGECILCIKKGVMRTDSSCRKFKYNPLNRRPKEKPLIPEMDEKEFEL
ncbi:MAG TPA: hypothetical protein VFD52_08430 [Clostridia bacterium]|nr:hypothetical protein [Clostridia bacterium]